MVSWEMLQTDCSWNFWAKRFAWSTLAWLTLRCWRGGCEWVTNASMPVSSSGAIKPSGRRMVESMSWRPVCLQAAACLRRRSMLVVLGWAGISMATKEGCLEALAREVGDVVMKIVEPKATEGCH